MNVQELLDQLVDPVEQLPSAQCADFIVATIDKNGVVSTVESLEYEEESNTLWLKVNEH